MALSPYTEPFGQGFAGEKVNALELNTLKLEQKQSKSREKQYFRIYR